jgi:AraC-like DNA-binding protein
MNSLKRKGALSRMSEVDKIRQGLVEGRIYQRTSAGTKFRTPLSIIVTSSKQMPTGESAGRQRQETIHRSSKQPLFLADQLQDLCNLEMSELKRALQPRALASNQTDARFLQRVIGVIKKNLADFEFDVDELAHSVAISRRQLFRKLKAAINTTPNILIRSMRLKHAAQLLMESDLTVTETTFAVGFVDVKHFRKIFKEQFGILPSKLLKKRKALRRLH